MEAMYRKSALAAAVSAMLLLAACGGGKESETAKAVDADDVPAIVNPDDGLTEVERRLKKAEEAGIAKIAYALSSQLGAYGKVLQEDGWTIQQVSPDAVPNEPTTVVIVNAEAPGVNPDALYEPYKQFKGVLIVDSQRYSEAVRGITQVWDEEKQDFVDKTPDNASNQSVDENQSYPSADFYALLSRGEAKQTPLGTALITSASTGTLMAIHVMEDGSVNGAGVAERQLVVNPLLNALTAKEASEAVVGKMSSAPGGWDRIVDFAVNHAGWNLYGRVLAEALRTGDNRFFVATEVFTGNNHVVCLVNGVSCGVYPTNNNHLMINLSHHAQGHGVRIHAVGPAYAYRASARVNPARSVFEYAPSAEKWTNPANLENDAWERVWTEGWSLGGSLSASSTKSFSATLSGGYSRSTTHRSVTHRWDASSGHTGGVSSGGAPFEAWTRINLKEHYNIWSEIYTNEEFLHPGYRQDAYGNGGRSNMRRMVVNGRNCNTAGSWFEYNLAHGAGRPRMSFEGWNPSMSATFEVPAARIMANDTNSFADLNAGVQLIRPLYTMERRNDVVCATDKTKRWGYRLVHPTTGAFYDNASNRRLALLGKDWNEW